MKKTLLTMAAALALVSCSQDDLMQGIENRPSGAIDVKPYVPTITRGTALNNEGDLVKAGNGFDLFAFLSDNSQFMGTALDGVAFQGSGDDTYAWDYVSDNEMKFWSEAKGSAIKFYAVSPMNEKTTALTTGSLTKNITAEKQELTYTVPTTCSEQVDLMYAVTDEYASNDETAEHVTNGITLQFRHALSQIVFKAKTESELIYADIESVKITNLNGAGTFNLANAETYREAADKTTATFPWIYTDDAKSAFAAEITETTDINTDAISLTESTEALLLLPQNLKTNNAALEISCKVRYKRGEGDVAEIVGSSTEYKTITVPVETSWEPGYKYTYTLIFTAEMGNPIKVMSVGVDEWNNATEEEVNVEEPTDLILGSGTEEDPYIIDSEKKLLKLATQVNEGDSKEGKFYKQTVDLDLNKLVVARSNEVNWTPIGLTSDTPFLGTYDAQNHSVKNLFINVDSYEEDMSYERCLGLFGNIGDKTGIIKNLTVNGTIKGSMSKFSDNYSFDGVAALFTSEYVQLKDVTDNVNIIINIDGTNDLIKLQERANLNIYNNTQISYIQTADIDLKEVKDWTPIGTHDANRYFYASYDGNDYKISNLTITSGGDYAGLFGNVKSESSCIKNIQFEEININTAATNVGAVCGFIYFRKTVVQNCHVLNGTITQTSTSGYVTCGGIAGLVKGTIVNCSNNSTIKGGLMTGGLAGRLTNGKIIASINTGTVSSDDTDGYRNVARVGGLAGELYNDYGDTHIIASINRGEILKGTPDVYACIGGVSATTGADNKNYGCSTSIIGCVYDNTTTIASDVSNNVGIITGNADKSSKIKYCFYKDNYEGSHEVIYTDGTEEETASANCYKTSTFATHKEATNAAIAESLTEIKSSIPNFPYTTIELVEEEGEIKIKCTE